MRVQGLTTVMGVAGDIRLRAGADPRRAPADTRATPVRQLDDLVLTRPSFLAAGVVALGLSACACGAAPVAHGHRVRLRLTLWAPTGPYAIGTVQLRPRGRFAAGIAEDFGGLPTWCASAVVAYADAAGDQFRRYGFATEDPAS
jgi:hypothetical protein